MTAGGAPGKRYCLEVFWRNMRNAKHDDLVAQQTRESIVIRMESFGDGFERWSSAATRGMVGILLAGMSAGCALNA